MAEATVTISAEALVALKDTLDDLTEVSKTFKNPSTPEELVILKAVFNLRHHLKGVI